MQRCKCLWFSAEVLSLNSGREADLSCFVTLLRHHIPLLASLPKGIINNSPQLLRGPSVPHALFVWRRPFTTDALVGGCHGSHLTGGRMGPRKATHGQ